MKNKKIKWIPGCLPILLLTSWMFMLMVHPVAAQAPNPSGNDVSAFNSILEPVWKVYNLAKYIGSALASIFLVFAGATYMMSGNDMVKRENAKHMISYVVLGLIVIWAAPFIVQLFTA